MQIFAKIANFATFLQRKFVVYNNFRANFHVLGHFCVNNEYAFAMVTFSKKVSLKFL